MSKALPWNVKTAGFDARNAAREAARRQGKSLGEWLHGVIADHAADLGVDEREMEGQQRINAVTSKLERLSARSADHDRRSRAGRSNDFGRRRLARDSETDDRDETPRAVKSLAETDMRRRREAPSIETTELLLEQAIDAMESRARRAEERTDNALQSFAKVLERNEAERNLERNSVNALTQKLSAIESRLGKEIVPTEANPIKGALERLESRLDSIGAPQAAAQTPQPQTSKPTKKTSAIGPISVVEGSPMNAPSVPRASATFSRLEEKLNLILKAPADSAGRPDKPRRATVAAQPVAAQPVAAPSVAAPAAANEPVAPHAVGPAYTRLAQKLNSVLVVTPPEPAPGPNEGSTAAPLAPRDIASDKTEDRSRGLGKAISDIMKRQRALEHDGPRPQRPLPSPPQTSDADMAQFSVMQKEIATLAATIDTLRQDVIGQKKSRTRFLTDIEAIADQIGHALRDLAGKAGTVLLAAALKRLSSDLEGARRQGLPAPMLQPVASAATALRRVFPQIDLTKEIETLQNDLPAVVEKIVGFVHSGADISAIAEIHDAIGEIRDLAVNTAARPLETERLERQITFMIDCLDRQTHYPRVNQDLATESDELRILMADREGREAIGKISKALSGLVAKIKHELNASDRAPVVGRSEIGALEAVVRDLSEKLNAVQAPGGSGEAFEALQQQVTFLSDRFERSDEGLAKLTSIEKSVGELFKHLEETREGIEATATQAARDVLRVAREEGRLPSDQATDSSLAKIRTLQHEAEARTTSTLSAVHGTLEKVVDRLAVMEAEIARTRGSSGANPSDPLTSKSAGPTKASTTSTKSSAPVATTSHLLEQMLGHRPGDEGTTAKLPVASMSLSTRSTPRDAAKDAPDPESGRADFIAAARRAAQVAQADLDLRRPPATKSSAAIRAGLTVTSRDYVARHKRPILLTIAALFVIAGTIQLIKLAGIEDNTQQTVAVSAPPAGQNLVSQDLVSQDLANKGATKKIVASANTLPTVALPPKTVSGTDPIQTGSTPILPSFAAGGVSRPQPAAPTIPQNLVKMAEAGSGAAEYALGVQYADGDLVPRNFARAAEWYQKAADQNIAPAEYRLASLYEKGLGVTQDKTKAKALYLRAAEAGNPRAMHNLAVLLADGEGKPDYEGAAVWFRKAAQYGIHDSQYNLAILLARGIGMKQSLVQSYQWFAIAAEQGDVDAAKKRDEVGTKLSASDIAVAKSLATTFRPRESEPAAIGVQPPPGGWDGASKASPVNSPRPKISSL